jgi:hypothetical protein
MAATKDYTEIMIDYKQMYSQLDMPASGEDGKEIGGKRKEKKRKEEQILI